MTSLLLAASLALSPSVFAQQAESPEAQFERRIAGRAEKMLEKLKLPDPALAEKVRPAVLRFYRDLHAAHEQRDVQLRSLAAVEPESVHRVQFAADKRSQEVYGQLIGALAPLLADAQIDGVKDWMTFDMVPLSVAEYDRMFPTMTARQKAQIRFWLEDSREASVIAGSAEAKLDVFRVNKMRMHTYLAAQGFDVETAVKAEAERKAAAKKPE